MAGRYHNSPRGAFGKTQVDVGGQVLKAPASTYVQFSAGLSVSGRETYYITEDSSGNFLFPVGIALSGKTAAGMTQNSTGMVLTGGVRISNKKYITANSTGFILTTVSTKPAADNGAAFTMVSNSTGVALAVNSTGATWKWLLTTSVQPT